MFMPSVAVTLYTSTRVIAGSNLGRVTGNLDLVSPAEGTDSTLQQVATDSFQILTHSSFMNFPYYSSLRR